MLTLASKLKRDDGVRGPRASNPAADSTRRVSVRDKLLVKGERNLYFKYSELYRCVLPVNNTKLYIKCFREVFLKLLVTYLRIYTVGYILAYLVPPTVLRL